MDSFDRHTATTAPRGSPPVKTTELQTAFVDSTRWNDFPWRPDDIVIATYGKSGTTWTQQIVRQILHRGSASAATAGSESPWVDMRMVPLADVVASAEAQPTTTPRFLKTHLPRHAMVWRPGNKYIYVARDGRDTVWSFVHHLRSMSDGFFDAANNQRSSSPGGPAEFKRPGEDPYDMFLDLLKPSYEEEGGSSLPWAFWAHIAGWYEARDQPNLLLIHFNDLKADLEGEMRRIAKFLFDGDNEGKGDGDKKAMSEEQWKQAVEHSTFNWMKENAGKLLPTMTEDAFKGGPRSFINKGTNGRWKDRLSEEDIRRYKEKAELELGPECAAWLENGRLGASK